jgi:site-specific recombinase XerD
MATIHKRRTGSGETAWELTHGTGKDRRRFVAGRTREEAEAVLREFKKQLALHGAAPSDAPVERAVAEYGEYLRVNRRKRTTRRYKGILRAFSTLYLARRRPEVTRLRDVKPFHIEEYKRLRSEGAVIDERLPADAEREQKLRVELAARPGRAKPADNAKFGWLGRHSIRATVSARTVNYELLVLFTFFKWAMRRNYLFVNPAAQVERFRIPRKALPKFVTSGDLSKFFGACTPHERRLYMAILLTGMRKGEAEHLTWEDVSFDLGVIFIREKPEVGWQPKTDERLIPISAVLNDVLVEQLASRTSDCWVFANASGNRDTHILERLKRVCRRAAIKPTTVHALRHSFGAHLRMAGASLADIADLLGHKDLATTQIYAKVQQEHLRSVVSKLSPLVEPQPDGRMSLENVTERPAIPTRDRKLLS